MSGPTDNTEKLIDELESLKVQVGLLAAKIKDEETLGNIDPQASERLFDHAIRNADQADRCLELGHALSDKTVVLPENKPVEHKRDDYPRLRFKNK
jgi:hypothetical protein